MLKALRHLFVRSSTAEAPPPPEPPPSADVVDTAPNLDFKRPLPLYGDMPAILEALRFFNWRKRLLMSVPSQPDPGTLGAAGNSLFGGGGNATPTPTTAVTDDQIWKHVLSQDDRLITIGLSAFCKHFLGHKVAPLPRNVTTNQFNAQYTGIESRDFSAVLMRMLVDETAPEHLTEAQKEIASGAVNLSQETKDGLLSMYTHIMDLMKAVLVRLYCDRGSEIEVPPFRPNHAQRLSLLDEYDSGRHEEGVDEEMLRALRLSVPNVMRNLLGDLDSLRIVLIHAEERGFASLGNYPHDWTEFIRETVNNSNQCLANMQRTEQQLLSLRQVMQARDQALNDVHQQFLVQENLYSLVAAERTRLRQELENSRSVAHMLGCGQTLSADTVLNVGSSTSTN